MRVRLRRVDRSSFRQAPTRCSGRVERNTDNLLVPDILLLLPACLQPVSYSIIETNQIKMENIGSGSVGVGAGPAAPVPHHSNYNCDISLVSGGDRRQHQHQSSSSVHHSHHLSLHDREKSFSVNHLLELPGQQAHMYHAGLHDSVGSDLQRVNQTLGVDQHHRLNSQQLKLQEGRTDE